MTIFKWGIIGLGRIAHRFATELQDTGLGKVTAVASRDINKAKTFADQYDIEHRYGSYEELINAAAVDAVYIAVPHHLHHYWSEQCLMKGIAVLCEKPFTINAKQLADLISISKDKNVFLMEGMWTRFMPHILRLKELTQNKELGEILHMKSEFCFKGKERGLQLGLARLLENELGGGALLDIGIYPVFLTLLLLGPPKEIMAQASIVNQIDESNSIVFKYPKGVSAYVESSILWESQGAAIIYYERGTVTIPSRWHESKEIQIKYNDGNIKIEKWEYPSRGFYYEIKEVQECVQQGKTQSELMNFEFSLSLMHTLDRIREIIGLKYPADLI